MLSVAGSNYQTFGVVLLGGLASLHTVVAQTNYNPDGTGCVDPQGFVDCYSAQADQLTSCTETAKNTCSADEYQTCLLGCSGAQLAGNVGCWVQSCWNQVSFHSLLLCDFPLTRGALALLLRVPSYCHRVLKWNGPCSSLRRSSFLSATRWKSSRRLL